MQTAPHPIVKICCISSIDEARLAVAAGASALGLVSAMPSGPGVITEQQIAEIAASVPAPVATFLLTARQLATDIAEQHRHCGTNTIQLVDHVSHDELRKLRALLPGVRLVQVIHVVNASSIVEAKELAPLVDALLLDSGNQALPVKQLGGTGRTHDWSLSRRICQNSPVPVFLAGGLNDSNIVRAVSSVTPYGVDLCSGVRTEGHLDALKLRAFFSALRSGVTNSVPDPG